MKISYDNNNHGYIIDFEDLQPLFINTDDIIGAKKYLIEHMAFAFNNAMCEQLAYDGCKETVSNKTCKSDDDHEWECCGVSTAGTTYRCKKCYAHKDVPFTTNPIETYLTDTSVVEEIIDKVIKEN